MGWAIKGDAATRRDLEVIHPHYGTFVARDVRDRYEAVLQAAKTWGMRWTELAKCCEFRERRP